MANAGTGDELILRHIENLGDAEELANVVGIFRDEDAGRARDGSEPSECVESDVTPERARRLGWIGAAGGLGAGGGQLSAPGETSALHRLFLYSRHAGEVRHVHLDPPPSRPERAHFGFCPLSVRTYETSCHICWLFRRFPNDGIPLGRPSRMVSWICPRPPP